MALNILIADDSAVMRGMISRALEIADLPVGTVLMAENGDECLKLLDKKWVDLLFLDLNMPVMDGFQVLRALSRDEGLRGMPVIVVSADSNKERLSKARAEGVTAFVSKPFTPERFKSAVVKALGEEAHWL